MNRLRPLVLAWLVAHATAIAAPLEYAPAPPDNPLKGLVPYAGQATNFPHSLEFRYLPLRALMTGPNEFNWQPIEKLIESASGRGCQTVFRVYLEYTKLPVGVPQFLLDGGLLIHTNTYPGSGPIIPNYEDSTLRSTLTNFIAALGRRYDGDPRVGFITAGLLGNWGEWHTSPFRNLWASKTVQQEVMDAYEAAFKKTPILVRYPAAEGDYAYAANQKRRLGYHDDSFAYATMPTSRKGDSWFFMPRMEKAGPEALNKWRTKPIGGEVRPEVWSGLWDEKSSTPPGQEFLKCVEATHATWLMDSSIVRKLNPSQRERAIAAVRRMGYEFHVTAADIAAEKDAMSVSVNVVNKGVAPFYYDWPMELAAINSDGKLVATWRPDWKLNGLLPDEPARVWQHRAEIRQLSAGSYRLLLRVPNPMPGGRPLKFANRSQDRDLPGWLTLGGFNK